MEQFNSRFAAFRTPVIWAGFVVAIGIGLRSNHLLGGRSLWADELSLALNILDRSFIDLAEPLDFRQMAPVLFLWAAKAATLVFGASDISLRLVPFLCGVGALIVFWRLTTAHMPGWPAAIATTWFATLDPLIYFSAEFKQYSLDLLVACCLLQAGMAASRRGEMIIPVSIALAGIILVWASNPSAFILAGIGGAFMISAAINGAYRIVILNAIIASGWGVSFWIQYKLFELGTSETALWMRNEFWVDSFFRIGNTFPSDLFIFGQQLFSILGIHRAYNLASHTGLAAFLFIAGLAGLWRKDKQISLMLAVAIGATFGASALSMYPIHPRLILFLVPVLIIGIIEGTLTLIRNLLAPTRQIALAAAIVILAIYPFQGMTMRWLEGRHDAPFEVENTKALLAHVAVNRQAEDRLYLLGTGARALKRYGHDYGLDQMKVLPSKERCLPQAARAQEIEALRGSGRTWLLMAHMVPCKGFDEQAFIIQLTRQNGHELAMQSVRGGQLYLFDF